MLLLTSGYRRHHELFRFYFFTGQDQHDIHVARTVPGEACSNTNICTVTVEGKAATFQIARDDCGVTFWGVGYWIS